MLLRSCLLVLAVSPAVLSNDLCETQACFELADEIEAGLNPKINPCDNFYGFVCGGNPRQIDPSFVMIDILNNVPQPSPVLQQAQIYYKSCIQQGLPTETRINFAALNRMVQDLGGWRNTGDLSDFDDIIQTAHQKYQVEVFFSWRVTQDIENPAKTIPTISLDSINADSFSKASDAPDQFSEFVLQLLHMWNRGIEGVRSPTVRVSMTQIIELHKQLRIRPSLTDVPRKVMMSELNELAGFIDWDRFFEVAYDAVGIPIYSPAELVQIEYPETLIGVAAVIRQYMEEPTTRDLLAQYIILRALFDMSQNLAVADENLEARCVEEGFTEMTAIFNAIYVRAMALSDARVREDVTRMYFTLKRTLLESLPKLIRLDSNSVSHLSRQLGRVHFFAGFMNSSLDDDHFARKYGDLNLGPSFIENKLLLRQFTKRLNVAHMPRYVGEDFLDRFKVTEANAFFSNKRNSIYLPLGLMQKPFFQTEYPESVKYGALGAILTHEMTHALMAHLIKVVPQDAGLSAAQAIFGERAQCFESQYAAYGSQDSLINSTATLEENIGDNIGLTVALHVFGSQSMRDLLLPRLGFNSLQLFFVSYARSFCSRIGEKDSQAMLSPAHMPDHLRVNGVLSNIREFSYAFRCERNRNMNPDSKCSPWAF